MCYEELYTNVVVSCLTEAPLKYQPVFSPFVYAVVCLTLTSVLFCVSVIIANRPPATLERQLTSGSVSVNVTDSVTTTTTDDDDDDSATQTNSRQSVHQFAAVLATMPLQYPADRLDDDIVLTNFKRRYWRCRLIWGWMMSSNSPITCTE